MAKNAPQFTLSTLAKALHGDYEGPADLPLIGPAAAGDPSPMGVTFAESEEYLKLAESVDVGAIIVSRQERASDKPLIRVENPRVAFGMLLGICDRPLPLEQGIHPTAVVHESANVHESARIGPFAVVEDGVDIGPEVKIYPFSYIGENCTLGRGTVVYPHVVLYKDVTVGERCILHSGCVLGADGFGFLWDGRRRIKVPQVGGVTLGDSVEVGANTTVDRATAGQTQVGHGTKLDNLVQVGHNVSIGTDGVIAGQSGISGSSKIGDRVVMGGNVGLSDHVTITDDVTLGGRSGVDRDIKESGEYFGTPARPMREAVRTFLTLPKLPEMMTRLRALEKEVEALRKGKE